MKTETPTSVVKKTIAEDIQLAAACIAEHGLVPPDIARRIRAASEKSAEGAFQEFGLLDISVPAQREFRDR